MAPFAMFPLGSVLFPHMPLALRVFEERYLVMMSRVLGARPAEFGVVLIESGREAAGAEAQRRFRHGTVAEVTELGETDGMLAVLARGGRRIEVVEWLDDDPHPAAIVRDVPELEWDPSLAPLLAQAELVVRRTIARASEFVELPWDADVGLSDDPVASAWQLAGIAPLTPLDQVRLLGSRSLRDLLVGLIDLTHGAGEVLTAAWTAEDDLDAELASLGEGLATGEGTVRPGTDTETAETADDTDSTDRTDSTDATDDPEETHP
ncbi:LON peptidase substrate-binding domain-containing protein [Agromyces sp. C10]|uniref:LON peptidase substrate-binding domain-containing protein n=1 Tax=Agromyces sp. C10 TaxID=2935077 RepID=UPI002009FE6C|nr:LON peptidase substrate-binding domain-containing protein [Agromyces sp. C10]MCK8608999.1 LON peptidase substrate-binding domain-containing protein [Agromyces sp. C10]